MLKTLVFFLLYISLIKAQNPSPKESYPNQYILQQPDLYYLYWKHDNLNATFEIHYKNTTSWVLFGLSSNNFNDVIVGWVNNDGTGHFSDRKLTMDGSLTIDNSQDWYILDAYAKNNYKILTFTRLIKMCDSKNLDDIDILPNSTNRIVYASGDQANNNDGTINLRTYDYISGFKILTQSNGPFLCRARRIPPVFDSTPTGYYSNYIDLVDGIYRFYWNFTTTDLIGEIHVKTNGWVGFGISPNGGFIFFYQYLIIKN